MPMPEKGRHLRGPDDVDAHPRGSKSALASWIWWETSGNGPMNLSTTHTRGGIAKRRKLLPAAGLDLVFPAGLSKRSAWQAAADGAQL